MLGKVLDERISYQWAYFHISRRLTVSDYLIQIKGRNTCVRNLCKCDCLSCIMFVSLIYIIQVIYFLTSCLYFYSYFLLYIFQISMLFGNSFIILHYIFITRAINANNYHFNTLVLCHWIVQFLKCPLMPFEFEGSALRHLPLKMTKDHFLVNF